VTEHSASPGKPRTPRRSEAAAGRRAAEHGVFKQALCPRVVIAGPSSGCGKTTVAMGLIAALTARGMKVSAHKVGPDYIDPGYHALASGRPGRNLDPFMCGEELIAPLFAHGACGADIAVIEGVMGLFDGVSDPALAGTAGRDAGPDFASTAHVARLLRAPVVLVVDAASIGRSVAAVVAGFARFDPRVRVAGVIFNRVASDRHERLLREAVEPLGVEVFGAIRRTDAAVTPSRHLGLVPVAERRAAAARAIAELAALVANACDLDRLTAVARSAPPLAAKPWDPNAAISPWNPGRAADRADAPVIAVAEGPAFTFSYTEHAELLRASGARLVPLDPLSDETLPEGTAGLVIGGGFPEVYAPDLSANAPLRLQVAALAASGAPIVAECAGLLYLARGLDGMPMCGVISADAHMTAKLTLGYRAAEAASDSVLARTGDWVRGHEFHRTAVKPNYGRNPAWRSADHGDRPARAEGYVRGNLVASYLHTHWAGAPWAAARLAAACRAVGGRGVPGGDGGLPGKHREAVMPLGGAAGGGASS
jgi:cobyrinic acid a,c-diamide synthase